MVERILPTTMVGSYPRPSWFRYQLEGRDVLEAFKLASHAEAFDDAVAAVLREQEEAGLDILTDGQMWFDDYTMGIGAFLWYWLERIHGFDKAKLDHPAKAKARGTDAFTIDEVGGVSLRGAPKKGPIRMVELYRIAQRHASRPIKACIGAGPVQLSTMVHYDEGPLKDRYALAPELATIFRSEVDALVEAGCEHVQLEDLGAWIPNLSGEKDFAWVNEIVSKTIGGVRAKTSWHFCLGNVWGNRMKGMTAGGYGRVLPRYFDAPVGEFVLDFACRDMADVSCLRELPKDKRVAAGVIDVRSLEVEAPEQVAERIRKVLEVVPAERVTVTTDCGMKQLPRICASQKLKALVEGTKIVRRELGVPESDE
jgi:5-methyltetrahydropteroyltriglutamate--homocysteine methyltransferase